MAGRTTLAPHMPPRLGQGPEVVWPSCIDYACTKLGNNLNGRVPRALLVCDGHDLAWTAWY
ncbi:hypothetical protein ACWD0J_06410 [Streptomyces sp. NPDC003011]